MTVTYQLGCLGQLFKMTESYTVTRACPAATVADRLATEPTDVRAYEITPLPDHPYPALNDQG